MNYRINTKALVFVGLLVIVAIGLFVYTLVNTSTTVVMEQDTPPAPAEELDTIITAKHQFKEGIHTIVGSVEVPTPCHRLLTEPFLLDGGATVEVRFSSLLVGEECASEPTMVPFSVTFEAPEDAAIQATWNGTPVRLNLIPVGPDEVLDADIYIKG